MLAVHNLGQDGAAVGHGFQFSQGFIGPDAGPFRHVACLLQPEFQQGRQFDLIGKEEDLEYFQELLTPGGADRMGIQFLLKLVVVMHGPPPCLRVIDVLFCRPRRTGPPDRHACRRALERGQHAAHNLPEGIHVRR